MAREDWDDLRYVLAVAETGTISAAARRLGVNHATVLRRVAQFEQRIGTELFEKTPRGYMLAPDLARVIEAARDVDRAVQTVQRLLAGARAPLTGEVRITSTDSFCQCLLPPILARIATEAPALKVTLISSNGYVDLGRTEADVAVRPTARLPGNLIGERPALLGFGLYRARGAGAEVWLGLTGQLERTVPARWMADHVGADRIGDASDSFLTLRELAAAGRGMAILPHFLAAGDARLAPVTGLMPALAVDVWVASHADLADVPRIALMRRLLTRGLAAEAARLLG